MQNPMKNRISSVLPVLLLASVCFGSFDLEQMFYGDNIPPAEPTLFIAVAGPNGPAMAKYSDANIPVGAEPKIVVATHGWFEHEPWPQVLALAIRDKVDANEWLCGWFDWRRQARVINPRDAAEYARDKGGQLLAEQILAVSKEPRHVHLIGHSAGSWAISEAAKRIADETDASIHLTFLDAYVPLGWAEAELGEMPNEPNFIYWADHYLTKDVTMRVTERLLTHAQNVDISDITPGLKDHEFPRYWYPATVIGQYVPGDRYDGKQLFYKAGDTEYGFLRSLEAGEENWGESLKLTIGNGAVRLEKPKSKFDPLGWLFGREKTPR